MRALWTRGHGGLLVVDPAEATTDDVAAPIDRLVYVAGQRLRCLRFNESGALKSWERRLPGDLIGRVNSLVIARSDEALSGYDLRTGDPAWTLGMHQNGPLLSCGQFVLLGHSQEGSYCVFDFRNGKRIESGACETSQYRRLLKNSVPVTVPPPLGPTDLGEFQIEHSGDELLVSNAAGSYLLSVSPEGRASAYHKNNRFWQGRL